MGIASNRILTSLATGDMDTPAWDTERGYQYAHDANGNLQAMPHLPALVWDYANRLVETKTTINTRAGAPDTMFCTYGADGQRVRRVVERGGVPDEEYISLGLFEVYRQLDVQTGRAAFERHTLHVMDGQSRIGMIERRVTGSEVGQPELRTRYVLANTLQSSMLELDENGGSLSYEEYSPYGETVYMAGAKQADANRRRFRYSGKERDDLTGLYYFGARYYAPWMGRWVSADPAGDTGGTNTYCYCACCPTTRRDPTGTEEESQGGTGFAPQPLQTSQVPNGSTSAKPPSWDPVQGPSQGAPVMSDEQFAGVIVSTIVMNGLLSHPLTAAVVLVLLAGLTVPNHEPESDHAIAMCMMVAMGGLMSIKPLPKMVPPEGELAALPETPATAPVEAPVEAPPVNGSTSGPPKGPPRDAAVDTELIKGLTRMGDRGSTFNQLATRNQVFQLTQEEAEAFVQQRISGLYDVGGAENCNYTAILSDLRAAGGEVVAAPTSGAMPTTMLESYASEMTGGASVAENMSLEQAMVRLQQLGPGSRAIVSANRVNRLAQFPGEPAVGHSFNAANIGGRVVVWDAQAGTVGMTAGMTGNNGYTLFFTAF